ncbi:YcaO-like family protein [Streptoverticillium reticulum]|uniref:YcaO-like family protein n=1 Tax=Streptoverticillium reticulum TaxID=1433415 RepID=UPI0039BED9E3
MGNGKGFLPSARAGALFEALEHTFSGPRSLESLPLQLRDTAGLLDGALRAEPSIHILARQRAEAACVRYTALDGGGPLDVPIFLWAPWYLKRSQEMAAARSRLGDTADYRPVLSCSVNTGCAIGATEDEALLHALNEWAERDAFSLFLVRSVHDGGPLPSRIPATILPTALRHEYDRAAALAQGPVALLDLTTDVGIPVVLACTAASPGRRPHYGLGASLSIETAVARAISELVQEILLRDAFVDPGHMAAVEARLAPYPRLLACARLSFTERLSQAPVATALDGPRPCPTSVAEQREEAVVRIASVGRRVVAHRLCVMEHGTTVVQVQCPGLERFHLITEGHLARLGARARSARSRQRGPR